MVIMSFDVSFIKIVIHRIVQKVCTGCKTPSTLKLALLNTEGGTYEYSHNL